MVSGRLKLFFVLELVVAIFSTMKVCAQSVSSGNENVRNARIETGVPFLMITPDARAGAMADAGVAASPDLNSLHVNPSKIAFLQDNAGLSLSYSPWLRHLTSDMYMAYLSGCYRLDRRNTVGLSLQYFSEGDVELREGPDQITGFYSPREVAIDGTLARSFGRFSLATTLRFIYSNLYGNLSGQQVHAGKAFAADISGFYSNPVRLLGNAGYFAAGVNISNIGNKIGYTDSGSKQYLPTNLKIGACVTRLFDSENEISFAIDLNKLLVPTPPLRDSEGGIIKGRDPDRSVPSAIFGSFTDAPDGISEELKEISGSIGVEYLYQHQLALRGGYFYENPEKGNRRFLTLGAGCRRNPFTLDFCYLLANQEKSPLANVLRFTLTYKIK